MPREIDLPEETDELKAVGSNKNIAIQPRESKDVGSLDQSGLLNGLNNFQDNNDAGESSNGE